jgi:hypothetical protein
MRDHELELIAALVEGRVEDESEARALIESSPELQAEYEAQKTAFEALSALGTASLTETERSSLRRDVWTELRAPVASAPSRSPWYYRWVPALAGMFVLVGLVAVISQGGGDDASESVARLNVEPTAADGADAGAGEVGADADEDEAMEEIATTSAATEDDLALSPPAVDFYSAQASMVRSGALEEEPTAETTQSPEAAAAPCLEAARLAGYVPLTILTAPIESDTVDLGSIPVPSESNPVIVAIPEGANLASAVIAFVDQDSCQVIHLDE